VHQTDDTATAGDSPTGRSFLKRFGALFALGMLGVVTIGVVTATGEGGVPGLPTVSGPELAVLVMIQPALLLAVAVAIGTLLAHRVGLRSHVAERVNGGPSVLDALRPELRRAVGVGVAAFLAVVALDALFAPLTAGDLAAATPTPDAGTLSALVASLPVRLFYGGITEELLLRWGLLTLFAWVVHFVRARVGDDRETLAPSTAWSAILLSAVLFGVGHLPALANVVEPTTVLVVRTVAVNAVAGVGFGWLYWRDSLEAAMVAHATFHVVLVGLSVVAVVFG
jgi:membrane protease YdiL (CAAX protease family)